MRAFVLASARTVPEAAMAERVRLAGGAAVMAMVADDRQQPNGRGGPASGHRRGAGPLDCRMVRCVGSSTV